MDPAYASDEIPLSSLTESIWDESIGDRLEAYSQVADNRDPAARAQACSSIDEDLSSIDAIRVSLRSRRNEFASVNRLSPESLSIIFHFLAKLWPLWSERRGLGWIQVTHVCRRWRTVACQDAALWAATTVNFPLSEQWSLEMMRRIRSLPFCFTFSSFTKDTAKLPLLKSLLTTHLHHIKELSLSITPNDMASILPALSSAAPRLRAITLTKPLDPSLTLLPPTLLRNNMPALQVIQLGGLIVRWDSDILNNNIRVLCIRSSNSHLTFDDVYRPSVLTLASALSRLSNLLVLQLDGCLPLSTQDFRPLTSVRLPMLRILHIKGTITECIAILGTLALPLACTLSIFCCVRPSEDAFSLIPLLMRVGAHLCRYPPSPPILTFAVEARSERTICLYGWRALYAPIFWKNSLGPDDGAAATFVLRFHFECPAEAALKKINALWNIAYASLPLQETRFLSIHIFHAFACNVPASAWCWNWGDQLSPFRAVIQCLIIDLFPEHSPSLFSALRSAAPYAPLQPLLPSLASLGIISEDIPDSDITDDEDSDSEPGDRGTPSTSWAQYQEMLIEVLRLRRVGGFGIKDILLDDWAVDAEFEKLLLSLVPKIRLRRHKYE